MRPDIGYGAARGPPGVALPPAADQACQRSCAALSNCPRSELPVARGHRRSGDGPLLCPARLPGAPHTLATDEGIGIHANVRGVVVCSPLLQPQVSVLPRGIAGLRRWEGEASLARHTLPTRSGSAAGLVSRGCLLTGIRLLITAFHELRRLIKRGFEQAEHLPVS